MLYQEQKRRRSAVPFVTITFAMAAIVVALLAHPDPLRPEHGRVFVQVEHQDARP
ncbi:hypothetical protein [Rhizobium sp. Root708]|uniref:hypothetical protein n=1 Tax=Rhizobium sp. Root708 TaxID=1736592 RepID=UPI000AAA628A|nr:hypothetical protein [Rhizobium sp. Root708]